MSEDTGIETGPGPEKITRRSFDHLSLVLIPFIYAIGLALGALRYLMPIPGRRLPELPVGPAQEFLAGKVARVPFNDRTVFVLAEKDAILALNARCPHLSCNVNWLEKDGAFLCPCHGMKFERAGTFIEGPTRKDMARQKFEVRDGVVVLLDDPGSEA